MKHHFKSFLALVMAIVMFSATGLSATTFNEAGTIPICTSTVTLTVGVPDNVRIEDYETNIQTQIIEEWGNYDLEFVVYPSTDYVSKINLMVMAGGSELPDILMFNASSVPDSMIFQWALAGAILPLTEYYEDESIGYYLNEAVERTGTNFFSMITSPDGEIYGVPTLNQSWGNEYPQKLYYYQPWLELLGMEEPTTTEEFRTLLEAVKNTDLNGNGKADEIPLTGTAIGSADNYYGWFNYLMNAFVYAGDSNYLTVDDGVVSVAYTSEAWKEGLKYIRDLVADELILPETLTQDKAQLTVLANSEDQVVFAMNGAMPAELIAATNDARNQYVGLAPLAGPEGVQYASYAQSVANISFMVTSNCDEPEAAFRMGDLMVCEYLSLMSRWGEEGVQWDYPENAENFEIYVPNVDGAEVMYAVYNDDSFWGGSDVTNASYRQLGPYIREYKLSMGIGKSGATRTNYSVNQSAAQSLYQLGNYNPEETIPKLIFNEEESDLVSEIMVTLLSYVEETTSNFLVGNLDIDDYWDTFQDELHNIGLDTMIETVQVVYDRMY